MSGAPTTNVTPAGDSSQQKQVYLPPGFTFSPTDEELVEYYLPFKIAGKSVPPDTILDFDIYSADPTNLPGDAKHGDRRNEKLFFTRRHASGRESASGIRAKRTVAGQLGGSWYGHTSESRIHCKSGLVGLKVPFTFKRCIEGKSVGTDWIMHEYRLASDNCRFQEWAICRIYNKSPDQAKRDEVGRMVAPAGGRLLPGYKFLPTDEEIIGHYLPLKMADRAVLPSYIIDLDVYNVEPWRLSDRPVHGDRRSELLFFTRRYNTGGSGVRARRTVADSGCWHVNTESNIECTSGISGRKAVLTFKQMDPKGRCVTTDWIMQEFRLTGDDGHFQEWAICRVYNNKKRKYGNVDESAVSIQELSPPMERRRDEEDEAQSPHHQDSSDRLLDLSLLGDQTTDSTTVSGFQQVSLPQGRSASGSHSAVAPGAVERGPTKVDEAQHPDKLDRNTLPDVCLDIEDRTLGWMRPSGSQRASLPHPRPDSGSGHSATPGAMERCRDEVEEAQPPHHKDKLDVDTPPDHVEYSGVRNHDLTMAPGSQQQSPPSSPTPASGSGYLPTHAGTSEARGTIVQLRPMELSPETLLELMQSLFPYMPDWVDAKMLQRWLRGGGATKRRKL